MSEEVVEDRPTTEAKEETIVEKVPTCETKPDCAMIDHVTAGFMGTLTPELDRVKSRLNELTQSQGILIDTIQQENNKFVDCELAKDLEELVAKVKLYYIKLTRIKQEMVSVQEKVTRLKKRALKMQAQRDREEMHKAQAREKELEIERLLVAKPATESYTEPKRATHK